jgi:alpha-acetolactate decarboxylase
LLTEAKANGGTVIGEVEPNRLDQITSRGNHSRGCDSNRAFIKYVEMGELIEKAKPPPSIP